MCGISSTLSPIDVDHIVPRSKAKNGKVKKDGKLILLNSEENLQALCFRCNRAKRDSDDTDFRRTKKLVRDNIPDIIRKSGREPIVKKLSGQTLMSALYEKLVEEHAEFLEDHAVEELGVGEVVRPVVEPEHARSASGRRNPPQLVAVPELGEERQLLRNAQVDPWEISHVVEWVA